MYYQIKFNITSVDIDASVQHIQALLIATELPPYNFEYQELRDKITTKPTNVPYLQLKMFCAVHEELNLITSFTAENIFHAANKALKHWGDGVIVITREQAHPTTNLKIPQKKFTAMLHAWYGKEKNVTELSAG